ESRESTDCFLEWRSAAADPASAATATRATIEMERRRDIASFVRQGVPGTLPESLERCGARQATRAGGRRRGRVPRRGSPSPPDTAPGCAAAWAGLPHPAEGTVRGSQGAGAGRAPPVGGTAPGAAQEARGR